MDWTTAYGFAKAEGLDVLLVEKVARWAIKQNLLTFIQPRCGVTLYAESGLHEAMKEWQKMVKAKEQKQLERLRKKKKGHET